MTLSNFYTDNVFDLKYNNIFGSDKNTFNASWDLQYIGNDKDYDESNLYTLCTDNDMNKYSNIVAIHDNINHVGVETEVKTGYRNAISFVASTVGLTDIPYSTARSTLPNCTYKSDRRYSANNYNNINNLDISKTYVYPIIYVIDKRDFKEEYFSARNVSIDRNKIHTATLAELYNNRNNYYVTAYRQRLIYITGANHCYDLGNTTPCRYMYQNDNVFSMAGVANTAQNYAVAQSDDKEVYGFWYAQTSTGVTASPVGFLNACKALNAETNNATILPVPVGSFDFTSTFDNTIEYYETDFDIWKVTSFMDDNLKRTSGVHVWKPDFILKLIASQGLYVSWNIFYNSDISLKNSGVMAIGEMDKDGFTTGKLILPSEIATSNSPNLNYEIYTDSIVNPNNYRPIIPDEDVIERMHSRSYGELTGFIKYYKMSREGLDDFIDACQEAGKGNVGFEYMPYINTVMQYPFNVLNYVSAEDHSSTIKINGVTLDGSYITPEGKHATGKKLTETQLPINNIATTYISRKYNNFLDYAPYTTIEVYIPFCGFVTLPSHCMGKDIQVLLIMDIINGTCKGQVYCEGMVAAEKTGTCGRTVALSGVETGLRNASVITSASGIASSALGLASGIATGNPVSVGYSAVSGIGAISQTMATLNNSYTRTTGNYGDNTNFHDSSCCYLKITRPVCHVPTSYGKNVGYICNKTKQLLNCKGYTIVENPELNFNCNYDEETEIKSLLRTGVIIK